MSIPFFALCFFVSAMFFRRSYKTLKTRSYTVRLGTKSLAYYNPIFRNFRTWQVTGKFTSFFVVPQALLATAFLIVPFSYTGYLNINYVYLVLLMLALAVAIDYAGSYLSFEEMKKRIK